MWTKRLKLWRFMLCILFAVSALAVAARADDEVPSESQCRPYIEKALKELESGDVEPDSTEKNDSSEVSVDDDTTEAKSDEDLSDGKDSKEDDGPSVEVADEPYVPQASVEDLQTEGDDKSKEDESMEVKDDESTEQQQGNDQDDNGDSKENASAEDPAEQDSSEDKNETKEDEANDSADAKDDDDNDDSKEEKGSENDDDGDNSNEADDKSDETPDVSVEDKDDDKTQENDDDDGSQEKAEDQNENDAADDDSKESKQESQEAKDDSQEDNKESAEDNQSDDKDGESVEEAAKPKEDSKEDDDDKSKEEADDGSEEGKEDDNDGKSEEDTHEKVESETTDPDSSENADGQDDTDTTEDSVEEKDADDTNEDESEEEGTPEEDLLKTGDIPENLRSRDHITKILRLDEEENEAEQIIERSADIVLRELKRLYENSIKPLEVLYKYRDLSNRHFGDPEIFSKPLVLFMGPWSGGKSSILNYLTGLEFTEWSLRTGAEPSPAYFNILMHGKDPEVLDGTQLAADWTFAGLQKFGQGLEERLRGLKYPSKILEKVNIVEIPGILEVRKQVSRVFPFNDACQWFIDRADIIFLVYDPSKLDVGPETEAILDQLKGRESQTRIVLNKADTVKPEELMRVQSALIWNISPLMSSAQPPVMYTVSLWSMPYEPGAPQRLLQAQERELLKDLRQAIDRRIENKIASARRFAVRVRNHAKMVDCYLTTYYNHKTIFGNKKLIADAIIENPQNYHIYEGLSTLTNISRYDLPDPETYRDFFRLNPVYEFQQLSATCTYFRGCPITRLDVAIAYDLPELVGKYKKMVETSTPQGMPKS
ncbi:unnamed protein product [Diatraea saccharalis]|uniref:Dynamin-type G domain-containing protein n=1 Tax=Diatraea saccharalis TaxID=40085 RepID=A0A9N9RB87_9NEOP|nr:unnamed protein product [Diatraea saccharalis]